MISLNYGTPTDIYGQVVKKDTPKIVCQKNPRRYRKNRGNKTNFHKLQELQIKGE